MLLQGVRILDLTRLLPGPYATMLMADLGAEVIKVEEPGVGDPVRGLAAATFAAVNRNKRSFALDLRQQAGQELCLRLAARCDVFMESFRPGVASALGLDYNAVRAVNPRIVYVSVTGWGQTGPLRHLAGHDLNYLSVAGILGVTGREGSGPVIPGVQMADLGGGMLAAFATASALLRARATGSGTYLDVAMSDLLASWLTIPAAQFLAGGAVAGWGNSVLSGAVICYNLYQTADNQWMALAALEPKFWARFCAAVHRPELETAAFHPARAGVPAFEEVAALFRQRNRDEWTDLGRQADCCLTPVLALAEALDSEQLRARGMLWSKSDGKPAFPAHPLAMPEGAVLGRGVGPGPAPTLGESTQSLLQELGLSDDMVAELVKQGIVAR